MNALIERELLLVMTLGRQLAELVPQKISICEPLIAPRVSAAKKIHRV
jgi:hypothetical protein